VGYLHILNLSAAKGQSILLFKRCYAMEKIHGSSSHIAWNGKELTFFAGGANHAHFLSLFNVPDLTEKFTNHFGTMSVTIYGEVYGGSMQKMSATYGKELKFIGFDVQMNENTWLNVPNAEQVIVERMGLEFVPYVEISTDLAEIDAARNAFSVVAVRRGCGDGHKREGIVLRPLREMVESNGDRVICKHKNDEFGETATPRKVSVDPADQIKLESAEAVANEYITAMRLEHVLDKHPECVGMAQTGILVRAMLEDVIRENTEGFTYSKELERAINKHTVVLYKQYLNSLVDD